MKYCVPKEPEKFPFILIGNKLDKQEERKVHLQKNIFPEGFLALSIAMGKIKREFYLL